MKLNYEIYETFHHNQQFQSFNHFLGFHKNRGFKTKNTKFIII